MLDDHMTTSQVDDWPVSRAMRRSVYEFTHQSDGVGVTIATVTHIITPYDDRYTAELSVTVSRSVISPTYQHDMPSKVRRQLPFDT